MFAIVGGANFYQEYGHPGGTPNLGWPLWILSSAASSPAAAANPAAAEPLRAAGRDPAAWLAMPPHQRRDLLRDFPAHAQVYDDMYAHPAFDGYWKQKGFFTAGYRDLMKDVPIYFVSGWYDYFAEGVLDNFTALSRLQKTPKKLLMGPWPHGPGGSTCGDGSFGAHATVKVRELALEWFDHWLKGAPLRSIGPEPVRIFRMGGGSGTRDDFGRLEHGGGWRNASAWPLPGTARTRYYLGRAGKLGPGQPRSGEPSTFVFDPANPVPTIGGRYGGGRLTSLCAQDQMCAPNVFGCKDAAPLAARPDVLSFSTAPLEASLDVTGEIRASLWIASDAPDTDFTAKLIDVHPSGYALILAEGQIRTRFRESFEREVMMQPGTPYQVNVNLGSTSNLFQRGHRIRLDISSSNYPAFEPNPNTGEPLGKWTRRVKARNAVFHAAGRASFLELPIVPAR
jgi:putative CocE/NonD family hydrolase